MEHSRTSQCMASLLSVVTATVLGVFFIHFWHSQTTLKQLSRSAIANIIPLSGGYHYSIIATPSYSQPIQSVLLLRLCVGISRALSCAKWCVEGDVKNPTPSIKVRVQSYIIAFIHFIHHEGRQYEKIHETYDGNVRKTHKLKYRS